MTSVIRYSSFYVKLYHVLSHIACEYSAYPLAPLIPPFEN